ARARSGRLANDIRTVVLVDGVCVARIRDAPVRPGEAAARAWIRRCARIGDRLAVFVRDVPVVFELGVASRDRRHGTRSGPPVLVAALRPALNRGDRGESWPWIRSDAAGYRSEPAGVLQAASGASRRTGIRGPQWRREPADVGC